MPTAKVSAKGWVVIPAVYRRRYGLRPGRTVRIVDYGGVLSIVPESAEPIKEIRGVATGETSLTEALLVEHAEERGSE